MPGVWATYTMILWAGIFGTFPFFVFGTGGIITFKNIYKIILNKTANYSIQRSERDRSSASIYKSDNPILEDSKIKDERSSNSKSDDSSDNNSNLDSSEIDISSIAKN